MEVGEACAHRPAWQGAHLGSQPMSRSWYLLGLLFPSGNFCLVQKREPSGDSRVRWGAKIGGAGASQHEMAPEVIKELRSKSAHLLTSAHLQLLFAS